MMPYRRREEDTSRTRRRDATPDLLLKCPNAIVATYV
jgi:hypothetical protein